MKRFLVCAISLLLLFSLCSFHSTQAEEKLLSQTSFMIPVVKGSTTYAEIPFTNLLDQESKYTVSVTRKFPVEYGMKIELDGFSVQEKYDVGPLQPNQSTVLGIRILCSDGADTEGIVSAKILVGSLENSRLSSIINVYVKPMDKKILQMHIDNANASVNGEEILLETPPLVQSGRTLVPFRWIGEQLDADVSFTMSEETKKVDTVSYVIGKSTITLTIGSTKALVKIDREVFEQTLDVPPFIQNGRTLVPLRFVSETLGALVNWTPPNTIDIEYPKEIPIRQYECVTFWSEIKAENILKEMEKGTELIIVDLRDETAYNNGHIPGAINVDFLSITSNFPVVTEQTEPIPVILYCNTGAKSRLAAEWVVNAGYQDVRSMLEGFPSWTGDIEKND
ncbi:MAG: stalk domain-containing protein [Caldisericia bacterium]|nr:stalk domain-containing protein [Caldisericia bacterium]